MSNCVSLKLTNIFINTITNTFAITSTFYQLLQLKIRWPRLSKIRVYGSWSSFKIITSSKAFFNMIIDNCSNCQQRISVFQFICIWYGTWHSKNRVYCNRRKTVKFCINMRREEYEKY